NFIWDASGYIPLLLDDGVNEYIYGNDRSPVAQISKDDGAVTYLHSDTIVSVLASTDSSGALIANTEYSPYGVNLGLTLSPFGFAGEWTDPDTKHSYLRARWLDTTTGTFLSRDPMVQVTREAYGYASGNPITRVDPLGLFSFDSNLDDIKDWLSDENNTTMMADLSTNFAGFSSALAVASLIPTPLSPILAGASTIIGFTSLGLGVLSTIASCNRDGWDKPGCHWGIATSLISGFAFTKPILYMGKYAKRNIPKHLNPVNTGRINQLKMNSQIGWGFLQSAGYLTDLTGRYKLSSKSRKVDNTKC
ncbi:MAG TPA: RHS repeat-associated core domain-containing protein, partial [Methanobacteriaceae archaeon]|nr:RHS repeat-associated core domain-containing protein [Methanobacteriaceae archaeon]